MTMNFGFLFGVKKTNKLLLINKGKTIGSEQSFSRLHNNKAPKLISEY